MWVMGEAVGRTGMMKTKRKTAQGGRRVMLQPSIQSVWEWIREQPDRGSICSQQREVNCSLSGAAGTLNMSVVFAGETLGPSSAHSPRGPVCSMCQVSSSCGAQLGT